MLYVGTVPFFARPLLARPSGEAYAAYALVGAIGIFAPRTLGVGYDNIEGMVAGKILGQSVIWLCFWKFVSWLISLCRGTPCGTLAPLFTIGGGGALGAPLGRTFPQFVVHPQICSLVGHA